MSWQPDYQSTIGRICRVVRGNADTMRGDPGKVAKAILQMADEPTPPLRLRSAATRRLSRRVAGEARLATDLKWQALGRSTDFDGLTDFAETPLAQALAQQAR